MKTTLFINIQIDDADDKSFENIDFCVKETIKSLRKLMAESNHHLEIVISDLRIPGIKGELLKTLKNQN